MLRKIQAVLAVLSTLIVFVIFAFLQAPANKAAVPNSVTLVGNQNWQAKDTSGPQGLLVNSSNELIVNTSFGYPFKKYNLATGAYISRATATENCLINDFAMMSNGNIVAAVSGNNDCQAIKIYSSTGSLVTSFGSFGSGNGQFGYLVSVAVDSANNIFTLELGTNNGISRVQKFNSSGTYITSFGSLNGLCGNSQFWDPVDVWVDSTDAVYVADTGCNRVQKFTNNGSYTLQFGTLGSSNGQFNAPRRITGNVGGSRLLIYDSNNDRVQEYTTTGSFFASYPLTGTPAGTYDFVFNNFAISPSGEFVFTDNSNNRILKYSSSGAYTGTISYQTRDNGNVVGPQGIAADQNGNIYVAEININRFEKFSSAGTFVSNLGTAYDVEFQIPWDIDLDEDGNIYVLDTGRNQIQVYDLSYNPITQFSGSGESALVDPIAMAVSGNNVYIVDRSDLSVKIFTLGGSFVSKFSSVDIVSPVGIDIGPTGAIYVTDYGDLYSNGQEDEGVLVFSPTGDLIRRVGFDGTLNFPGGVAVDEYGYTYVTECSGDKVAVFDDIGTYVTFFGYSGTAAGQLDCPTGIDIGPEREMIISDQGNNRVQVFRASIPTVTHSPTPTPTATPTPATWVNVGDPINPGGYTGSVFIRTDKVNQDPIVAYPEYSEGTYRVTVRRYNKSTGDWELVGNSRFTNPMTSSGQGRFSFDTCEDGRMVVLIADAAEGDKGTLYRYENGEWGVLGTTGATANNVRYGLGMFCQPLSQLPYLYAVPDPGDSDGTVYGYNFNPDLGGWVSIQEIPCTTSGAMTNLNPNLLIGDPVNNFTWYACSNGSVSEFTGTMWNNPVSSLFTSPTFVQDFEYDQGDDKWIFATEDVVSNIFRVYSSTGGSNKTQLGGSFDFPSEYDSLTFPASLEYNQTVDAMWYAVPTGNTTFVVKQFSGSSWGNVLNEFTETGLHADDLDLYHDPTCNGANYLALAIQTGAGQSSIIVKRDSSYIPCGELPTVTTGQVTSITNSSAVVGGEVVSDGYLPLLERGVVYSSSNSTPTLGDTIQSTSGTVGVMSTSLTDLQANTLYYARAYASNSLGTSYGAVVQFTTSSQPTTTPTTTTTSTPVPSGGTTIPPTASVTSSVTPTTLPSVTVSTTPDITITSRREAQQSPVCPVVVSFVSTPTIANEGERVELTWATSNTTKVTINGSLVAVSGSTPFIVPADRKAKLLADNGACVASEVLNFENPAAEQLQTATAVGASALVAEILLQQAVTFGTASLGTSGAVTSTNLWGLALSIFNRRKKRQAWGVVYDSKSKMPLGRVVIRLLNVDTEAVVDTVVSDAQGVFQLKTQPGRYLIRVVRAGYQFPSAYVKGESDGGYSHLYFGGVLTQGAADQQITISIPLDPEKETSSKKRTRVLVDAGLEALNTASTITLFAGFGYSLYVAALFPLPVNIVASVVYGAVCLGKLALTLWAPRTVGRVTTINGKPLAGIEIGIFDKEFNNLLYRTFTNEKGEYNFAVPNKEYVLRLMDTSYKVFSGNNTQGVSIPALKRKAATEVRLIAHDLVVNRSNNATK